MYEKAVYEMNETVGISVNTPDTLEVQQRKYLKNRAHDIYYEKQNEIERAYGMQDDLAPRTVEDLVERLTTGLYSIKENARDYWCPIDQIRWKDPNKIADPKGATAAKKKLQSEFKLLGDTCMIAALENGVAAVQKFEAAKV
jgi:hypothetical protein